MNLLDPVEVEEAVTTQRPSLWGIPDLTGKTWKLQIKCIDMRDIVFFCLRQ